MLRHIDKFLPSESQQIQLIVPQYMNPTLYNIHALVLKSKKKKRWVGLASPFKVQKRKLPLGGLNPRGGFSGSFVHPTSWLRLLSKQL